MPLFLNLNNAEISKLLGNFSILYHLSRSILDQTQKTCNFKKRFRAVLECEGFGDIRLKGLYILVSFSRMGHKLANTFDLKDPENSFLLHPVLVTNIILAKRK